MNLRRCSPSAALMMVLCAAPLFAQSSARDRITIRVIGDPVSAVDGSISLAQDFSHETGINVVVEKDGFKDALEKATNDLSARVETTTSCSRKARRWRDLLPTNRYSRSMNSRRPAA